MSIPAQTAAASGSERLPAVVDAAAAAALYRAWQPRVAQIVSFDLSDVRSIDSAGVALLRAMQTQRTALGLPPATLLAVPERYRVLCLAHRLDNGAD